jgi:hypothetical protein
MVLAWSLGALVHWWPRLRAPARRRLSIAMNVAALGFLFAAIEAEGMREVAITSSVILGPSHHTATASASASLYYYVLTGACLLLGFAGLAIGEPLARWLSTRFLLNSVALAWLVTVVRFLLEKSAAPAALTQATSVTWMAPVAGAYLAACLRESQPGWRPLLRTLTAYAFLVRGLVALLSLVATRERLGTHYDVSSLTAVSLAFTGRVHEFVPGSAWQLLWLTLVPQLVAWPVFTVLAGAAGAALWLRVPPRVPPRIRQPSGLESAAVGDGI